MGKNYASMAEDTVLEPSLENSFNVDMRPVLQETYRHKGEFLMNWSPSCHPVNFW